MPANPVVRGAALIVAGMVVIGFIDNFVRVIAAEVSIWQFQALRSGLALPLLGLAAAAGLGLRARRPGRVALRSSVQAAALLFYFSALPFMPIAQVGAGLFTAPLWVLLFSAVLFGHRIGPRQMLAVAVGFTGALVMLRPDPANLSLLTLVPVAAGALYGLSNLLTREWCADEPVGALLGGFFAAIGLAGLVAAAVLTRFPPSEALQASAPFLTRPWSSPSAVASFWIAMQAVGSLGAVGLITRGYQSAATGTLAVFEYSFLITASFWAWVLWGDALDAASLAGIGMIIASGTIVAGGAAAAPSPAQAAASAGANRP